MQVDRRYFLKLAGASATSNLLSPQIDPAIAGTNTFEVTAIEAPYKLDKDFYSQLWTYNGMLPGPEIKVTQGDQVRVRFNNQLKEPTSIHWHGIRIENAMDGVSGLTQTAVQPGESFTYEFSVPDVGTFWYHAHHESWRQVALGLYGPLIVDEPQPIVAKSNDLTLILDDWKLDDQGRLETETFGNLGDWSHAGRLGNISTVNGKIAPEIILQKDQLHRIRLINAANARVFQINPPAVGAQLIGLDGFLFSQMSDASNQSFQLAPAQRADLLLKPNAVGTFLLNDEASFSLATLMGQQPKSLAKFVVVDGQPTKNNQTVRLVQNKIPKPDLSEPLQVDLTMTSLSPGGPRTIRYRGKNISRQDLEETKQFWAFNGIANLDETPLFRAKLGQTVLLTTKNRAGFLHAMHVHGHHFQVISKNGQAQNPPVWRDTFTIEENESVQIAFVADNPGKWLIHCHMLEHAVAGMRTWFEVG